MIADLSNCSSLFKIEVWLHLKFGEKSFSTVWAICKMSMNIAVPIKPKGEKLPREVE
jgi:hypothetical protein